MPGLETIGPIAGKAMVPAPDPLTAAQDSHGLFIVGDAISIRHYSGQYPGYRWLCRASGKLLQRINQGPLATPGRYCTSREEAQAAYAEIRQQALSLGLQPADARHELPLNDPQCYAESFSMNGEELLRLFYDHMTDLQTAVRNTNAIWQFDARPGDPTAGVLASYHTQNEILYLAIARAPSGAAEHLVLVFSDKHKPEPTIREGMPRAEWIKTFKESSLSFPSGLAIAQWGRLSGAEVEWQENPQQPAQSLLARMGTNVAFALAPPASIAPRLGGIPAAYAVRMEPGVYKSTYYELSTADYGGFSCCAISREGAAPFLPVVLGNAGGMIHGNLAMEQYAMLSVERDDLLIRNGGNVSSPELAALCQKYGQQVPPPNLIGRIARVDGWEQMIQRDPAFSAQWAVQLGIARMRLQGIEPTKEQIEALGQHQNQVQGQLEAHNKAHAAKKDQVHRGARTLIQVARTTDVQGIVAACAREAPDAPAEWVFHEVWKVLNEPEKNGKVERIEEITEKLARAHYAVMTPADQKQAGKVESYVKEKIGDVYPKHGGKVPGLGGFLSRFVDKL